MASDISVTFIHKISKALTEGVFVKLSLGNYKGNEEELKQLYIKPVIIKRKPMLAFNFRYKTRDIFKNYAVEEGKELIKSYLNSGFNIATLFTNTEEFIIERTAKGVFRLRSRELAQQKEANLSHNKEKKRLIVTKNNLYLHQLGLTDNKGVIFNKAQDKYKQINRYVEILSSLIREFPTGTIKNVVDMGSGKGYLTFALYDYLLNHQWQSHPFGTKAHVTGVEFRKDLVDLCNKIAANAGFDQLSFIEGTIESYNNKAIDLLIALHACDTATDDAIYKGIQANAHLIVVAPCCHKQIRKEMEKGKAKNELSFLTKHGIFLERQAEMVTDGLRALILEYFGYKTKVFEFVSDMHTPKNVLVVGIRNKEQEKDRGEILQKIKDIKEYFGISYHYLEQLFGL